MTSVMSKIKDYSSFQQLPPGIVMDDFLDQIVHPRPKNRSEILESLHLASFSSTSEIHENIEKLLLSPPRAIPDHWLSSYQVFDGFSQAVRNS